MKFGIFAIAFASMFATVGASAEWSLGDVEVTGIQAADVENNFSTNAVYITFSAAPFPGCARKEWLLAGTTQNQQRGLSLLLAAHLAKKKVRIFKLVDCTGMAHPTISGVVLGEF